MYIQKNLIHLFTAAIVCSTLGCADDQTVEETVGSEETTVEDEQDGSKALSVDGRVFSIPAPAQTAVMLKSLGTGYNKELAAATDLSSQMSSKEEKALLMGVYGADLAYSVAFQDGQTGLNLFKTIQKVAADLSLENAIDKELVDRFMGNVGNDDSLLVLSGAAYRAADRYLKQNDRNDISSLVLAGGWLETMHIALSVHTAEPSPILAQRIAEQSSALGNLVSILESSSTNEKIAGLISGLQDLNSMFNQIPVSYTFEEPATDVANKTTFINSATSYELSGDTLASINEKVMALRTLILS
jgi:hypothetical protein